MTLNRSQRAIAKRVLELLRADGFVLVGGLALLELGVTTRPTEDLDAFSDRAGDIGVIAARVAETLRNDGFSVAADRTSHAFARFVVTTGRYRQSSLKVELGFDTLLFPSVESALGACASIRELGANKVLAAFARHEPRDLSDIYDLAALLPLQQMLDDAREKDHGFDGDILAEMIRRTVRVPDELWPTATDILAVRTFMADLVEGLREEPRCLRCRNATRSSPLIAARMERSCAAIADAIDTATRVRSGHMSEITRINPGPRMSQGVVHGDTVYTAGVVAGDTTQDVQGQTRQILATIDEILAKAGTDKSKLLRTNIWLSDISTWAAMNEVWDTWVVPGETPARATVQAQMAGANVLVEIMVVAAR